MPKHVAAVLCSLLPLVCGQEKLEELQTGEGRVAHLKNDHISAGVHSVEGLRELVVAGHKLKFLGDSWSLDLNGTELGPGIGCNASGVQHQGAAFNQTFECEGGFQVIVSYLLPPGGQFVEKRIGFRLKTGGPFLFDGVTLFQGLQVQLSGVGNATDWHVQGNPFQPGWQVAGFFRWPSRSLGTFVSVANPFGHHEIKQGKLYAGYRGRLDESTAQEGSWIWTEPAVLGPTSLSKYSNEGVNSGERVAFMRCVETYYMDHEMRKNRTVKVHVAWDVNDYQIDVGTEEGRIEYRRLIDRNSQYGVTHMVFEPQNTLHSNRFESTDGWGWEDLLWFSMGIQLRKGKWDPRTDDVPEDILDMVRYAAGKGVQMMAYVYPCLAFEKMRAHFTGKAAGNILSLAPVEVQDYMIEVMTAFMRKTGAAGFAWDHDITAGPATLEYAQWRGWMRILAALRTQFPDMVMDHRQTAHAWGPWYQLAGSYDEPIAGDENPETYGVPITSLSTDHVAADNTRLTNYKFSTQQLIPPMRVPGFIFHQTERTDDDGQNYCTQLSKSCVNNSNTRDFDLMGYKYSLLSTIGTAGLNNVMTYIPARDLEEFNLLPQKDVDFVRDWLKWTDEHLLELGNTQWIPTLRGPGLGGVDGTHSMYEDEGFIFLFNPNMFSLNITLSVDESLGLQNSTRGLAWEVHELYPNAGAVGTWQHGDQPVVYVPGSEARVLRLMKSAAESHGARLLHAGAALGKLRLREPGVLEVHKVSGPAGRESEVAVLVQDLPAGEAGGYRLSVNGVDCGPFVQPGRGSSVTAHVHFAGPSLLRAMPVGGPPLPNFTGGWFNTTFEIPQALKDQLMDRGQRYPVPWTFDSHSCGLPHCVDDSKATWLVPTRLLLSPFLAQPKDSMKLEMWLNGKLVDLKRSYNSRGRQVHSCFLGFYFDASSLKADTPHTLQLKLPRIAAGSFQGLFWENVETVYTSEVESCRLSPPSMPAAEVTLVV